MSLKNRPNKLHIFKDLTYGVKFKEIDYLGFKLLTNTMHCGKSGNFWSVIVLEQNGKVLDSFTEEFSFVAESKAKLFVINLRQTQIFNDFDKICGLK